MKKAERRISVTRWFSPNDAKEHEEYFLERKGLFGWRVEGQYMNSGDAFVPYRGNREWAEKLATHYEIEMPE